MHAERTCVCAFVAFVDDPALLSCLADVPGAFNWHVAADVGGWIISCDCDSRPWVAFARDCEEAIRDSKRAKALLDRWNPRGEAAAWLYG